MGMIDRGLAPQGSVKIGTRSQMIKVCIVTHSYPRFEGDWRSNFIEGLAKAYARNGFEVTVFVPFTRHFNRGDREQTGVKIVNFRYMPFTSWHTIGYGHSMKSDLKFNIQDAMLMPFLLVLGIIRLTLLLRQEKFDLIHAHWAVPNTLIAVPARFLSRSKATLFTSFPGSDVTVLSKLGWIGHLMAKMISASDYLSCNSADLKEDLIKAGIAGKRIDYVIYGVDDKEIFFSEESRLSTRRSLKVAADDVVLLLIGRFVPKKGFATAFQSLRYLTEYHKHIRLVVVGDGPLKDEYLDILRHDGNEPYVQFIGEIPPRELRSYYSACDIFLMPSRRLPADGLNVVVPEAMACGRPIVASHVGGNDLVISHGINGYLHDENDPKQLAQYVIQLLNDPALMKRMGDNSLKLVKDRFNWDAIARYYGERYRERVDP